MQYNKQNNNSNNIWLKYNEKTMNIFMFIKI